VSGSPEISSLMEKEERTTPALYFISSYIYEAAIVGERCFIWQRYLKATDLKRVSCMFENLLIRATTCVVTTKIIRFLSRSETGLDQLRTWAGCVIYA
jgi:hypothetical protein